LPKNVQNLMPPWLSILDHLYAQLTHTHGFLKGGLLERDIAIWLSLIRKTLTCLIFECGKSLLEFQHALPSWATLVLLGRESQGKKKSPRGPRGKLAQEPNTSLHMISLT
jgi:hypothetical protein